MESWDNMTLRNTEDQHLGSIPDSVTQIQSGFPFNEFIKSGNAPTSWITLPR